MYEVLYSKVASRQLSAIPGNLAGRILERIRRLAADPFAPNPNASALKGGGYRLRVGDWRVLYTIETETKVLQVAAVLPRGRAYR